MKTLIVSRTRSGAGSLRCIGGITVADGKASSIRLMNPNNLTEDRGVSNLDKGFWPPSAPYQVGDIWDLDLQDLSGVEAPHVEDKVVMGQGQKIGAMDAPKLETWLRENAPKITPPFFWTGGPWEVFGGKLRSSKKQGGTGYAVRERIPDTSTGFWVPDRALIFDDSVNEYSGKPQRVYKYQGKESHFGISRLSYVGEPNPVPIIPAGTLIRVSLARWKEMGHYPEACWLMMSGWY